MASLSSLPQGFLQSVAFPCALDDVRLVGHPVEQGRRHVRISEDLRPAAESEVCRHDDRSLATCSYIREHRDVLIIGATGAGKTTLVVL